jgi:two-component system response regulator AtoC
VPDTTLTIGSVSGNTLDLRSSCVSRFHCRIVRKEDGYYVVDQGSSNGTFLNGTKVVEAKLRSGDTLRVADVEIRVFEPEEPEETRFVVHDPKMVEVMRQVARVAALNATVLITGETGTGKEQVARAIHEQSPRKEKAFVPVNCGAIAESLLDGELFGHVRGAFTGAALTRKGLVEEADGGTLFLDEVAELSLNAQVKLLRALQEGTIRRVGESLERKVDARILAATHRDLERLIAEGKFREDLYYRINVARIEIPPLRERVEDVEALARHFLKEIRRETGREYQFTEEAVLLMRAYSWPGNVRDLQFAIERACLRARGESIGAAELGLDHSKLRSHEAIVEAAQSYPSLRAAAEALCIPKSTLHVWAKRTRA